MKRWPRQRSSPLVLLALVSAAALVACGGGDDGDNGQATGNGVRVVATTTQIGALTREVARDRVELTVLLAAGADAHDYEPSPKAVAQIKDAKVVLVNGIGLDAWLSGVIGGAGAERVVVVTDGIAVRRRSVDGGPEAGDHTSGTTQEREGHGRQHRGGALGCRPEDARRV